MKGYIVYEYVCEMLYVYEYVYIGLYKIFNLAIHVQQF